MRISSKSHVGYFFSNIKENESFLFQKGEAVFASCLFLLPGAAP